MVGNHKLDLQVQPLRLNAGRPNRRYRRPRHPGVLPVLVAWHMACLTPRPLRRCDAHVRQRTQRSPLDLPVSLAVLPQALLAAKPHRKTGAESAHSSSQRQTAVLKQPHILLTGKTTAPRSHARFRPLWVGVIPDPRDDPSRSGRMSTAAAGVPHRRSTGCQRTERVQLQQLPATRSTLGV